MKHLCSDNSSIGTFNVAKLFKPTDRLAKLVFSQRTYNPMSLSLTHLHGNIVRALKKIIYLNLNANRLIRFIFYFSGHVYFGPGGIYSANTTHINDVIKTV